MGGAGQFNTDAAIDGFRTGRVTFAAGSLIGIDTALAAGGYTYASNITDYGATPVSVGIAKLGANTLTLLGTNTYTGVTRVIGGTLQIGNGTVDSNLGTGGVAVSSGAALQFNVAGTLTNSGGVISGAGAVVKEGAGTLVLNQTASNTFSGGLSVNNGVIEVASTAPLGSASIPVAINGGTLRFNSPGNTVGSTTRVLQFNTANSTIDVTATSVFTAGGPITGTGALNKSGAGAVFVNNTTGNTFSGNYNVLAGVLGFNTDASIGTGIETKTISVAGGATVALDSTGSSGTFTVGTNRVINFLASTSSLTVGSGETWNYTGSLTGPGSLNKGNTGTLYLANGSNDYAGGTNINSGVVRANNGTTGSATGSGNIVVNAGGTLGGSGTVTGALNVAGGTITTNMTTGVSTTNGATITAGANASAVGTLATGGQTWNAGGRFLSKFSETATLGTEDVTSTGVDKLLMTSLDLSSLGASKFLLSINRATAGGMATIAPGDVYYTIATTTGTVSLPSGYDLPTAGSTDLTGLFTLDTSGVGIPNPTGITVTLTTDGGGYDLNLGYGQYDATPEPTTAALVGLGASSVLGRRRRRAGGGLSVLRLLASKQ